MNSINKRASREGAPCYVELIGAKIDDNLQMADHGIAVRRFRYPKSSTDNEFDRRWDELSEELIALALVDYSTVDVHLLEGTAHVQTSLQELATLHADYPHSGTPNNRRTHLKEVEERLSNFLQFRSSVYDIVDPPSTIHINEGRTA